MGYLLFNRSTTVDTKTAVIDNIHARASVRTYTEEPIDEAILEDLVKAGMAAPSGANMQPWEFIIITNKDVMKQYKDINQYAKMAPKAAAAIAVIGNMDVYKVRPEMSGYWAQDTSAATQNILLAAQAYGLGAVWTGVYSENTEYAKARMDGVSKLLNLPPNKKALNIIFLGHPDDAIVPKDKWDPKKLSWMK